MGLQGAASRARGTSDRLAAEAAASRRSPAERRLRQVARRPTRRAAPACPEGHVPSFYSPSAVAFAFVGAFAFVARLRPLSTSLRIQFDTSASRARASA